MQIKFLRRKRVLVPLVACFTLLVFGYLIGPEPVPELSEVRSITMSQYSDEQSQDKHVKFTVAEKFWQPIWDCLVPATSDPHPVTYPVSGYLNVRLANDIGYWIMLGRTEPELRYKSGRDGDEDGHYRIGGDELKLRQVLREAYRDSLATK